MDYEQIESSQRQHHEVLRQDLSMQFEMERIEYVKFSMIQPKLYKDGNQWCCLYGDNIQEGITGFGDTPYLAILDWNNAWGKQ